MVITRKLLTSFCKYIWIGIWGDLFILFGSTQAYPKPFYIIGGIALLITAMHYKLVFFVALEVIIVTAHLAIVLSGVGPYIQVALPALLCFQLFIFFLMIGKDSRI